MEVIQETNDRFEQGARSSGLPQGLTFLLAGLAGMAAATLYYSQPMLAVMGAGLHTPAVMLGFVPMLTQLGYALGIFFLAPLGDRIDRRGIILAKAALLAGALIASAATGGIGLLLAASLVVGLAATLAQDVVSASASLAPDSQRGRVVGAVMTGLLSGILLSRVVSGLVAQRFGWRAMYYLAAASIAAAFVAAWRGLPRIETTTTMPYGRLIASLGGYWRKHASLRRAALAQGLLAVGFSAFWSCLALMLSRAPFHLGSAVAGAFGLAGAAGAIAAPIAGRVADQRGPGLVTRLGTVLVSCAFGLMALAMAFSPKVELALIAVAVVGFDLGVQATLIAHQTIIYGIEPEARSRLNAVLFTVMFIGMALGSGLGSILFAHIGWAGVIALAMTSALAALLVRLRA